MQQYKQVLEKTFRNLKKSQKELKRIFPKAN